MSLVAEPMPARSGGTEVMIIAVNGLIVTDIPAIIGTSGEVDRPAMAVPARAWTG